MRNSPAYRCIVALSPLILLLSLVVSATLQPAPVQAAKVTAENTETSPISMSDPDGQEMLLEDLSVKAAVSGMLSFTELELRFRNPHPKRMEGRFGCVLPPGAAISRFAKEVNGRLMEGEVVERLRANRIYDTILHEMRDPALLEQDQGNRFSAKVFPIEANATVRLVLSYSRLMPLEDGVRTYSLPLRGMPTMTHFVFRGLFSSLPGETSTDLSAAKSGLEGPSSARSTTVQVLELEKNDYTPEQDVEIKWRPSTRADNVRVLQAGEFFLASFRAPDDLRPPAARDLSSRNADWVFYIDTSASAAEAQQHRIEALQGVLAALPPSDNVELIAFDQHIVPLTRGRAVKVAQEVGPKLEARKFLGGTDLEALFAAVAEHARSTPGARFVLATDGAATLGRTKPEELVEAASAIPTDVTLHALVLGARQDAATLKALTQGRGRIVTVPFTESLPQRAAEAAEKLALPPGVTVQLTDPSAEWLFPAEVSDVQPGAEVIAIGRLKAGRRPATRLEHQGSLVSKAEGVQALPMGTFEPLLEREGNRAYLDYLAEREANEASSAVRQALATEQIQVSIAHRVMISRTTLLVLESEADYQRFGLDRRALADILTIGATGIETLDRSTTGPVPIAAPQPRPITDVKDEPSDDRPRRRISGERDDDDFDMEKKLDIDAGDVEADKEAESGDGLRMERQASAEYYSEAAAEAEESVGRSIEGDDAGEASETSSVGYGGASGASAAGRSISAESSGSTIVRITESRRIASSDSAPVNRPSPSSAPPPPPEPMPIQQPERRPEEGPAVTMAIPAVQEVAGPEWTRPPIPTDDEVAALKAEIAANPRLRPTYNKLADALFARGEWRDLWDMALSWQSYDPENPQVYESLGEAGLRLNLEDEAARAFGSLVEIAPSQDALLQRAGLLLMRTNEHELAEAPLRRALELRPDRVNAYRHLALMLWQHGKLDEAAGVLESALKQNFADWYKDVHRVVREELGYIYRAILQMSPDRRDEIQRRAGEFHVDLGRNDALRITLAWETDANDVDLHVVDPKGEECYYSHRSTGTGLELYEDITQGLGPEVVRTDRLVKGTYFVGVNYFSAGPMGISRGVLVVIQPDARGQVQSARILPFRLIEGGADMRLLATVDGKGK